MGTLVNCFTIILGCIVGLFIKGKVNEKISTTVMNALGLCTLYIGISGSLKCDDPIQMIVSMAVGALIWEIIDIDKWLTKLGGYLENKFKKKDNKISISEGFVTSSLLFCVGAMAIVGSLESGLNGDNTTLYAKSVLDGVSSIYIFIHSWNRCFFICFYSFNISRINYISCKFCFGNFKYFSYNKYVCSRKFNNNRSWFKYFRNDKNKGSKPFASNIYSNYFWFILKEIKNKKVIVI